MSLAPTTTTTASTPLLSRHPPPFPSSNSQMSSSILTSPPPMPTIALNALLIPLLATLIIRGPDATLYPLASTHAVCLTLATLLATNALLTTDRTTHRNLHLIASIAAMAGLTSIVTSRTIRGKQHFDSWHGVAGIVAIVAHISVAGSRIYLARHALVRRYHSRIGRGVVLLMVLTVWTYAGLSDKWANKRFGRAWAPYVRSVATAVLGVVAIIVGLASSNARGAYGKVTTRADDDGHAPPVEVLSIDDGAVQNTDDEQQ